MEQVDLVPFSALIAGMLLIKRKVTSMDVVNAMSELQGKGTDIDDEDDTIDCISCCVEMKRDCSFCLKSNISYDDILEDGNTVREFLLLHSNLKINSLLQNLFVISKDKKSNKREESLDRIVSKPKVRRLSRFFLF